jgi:tRNA pseudouridine38-40 synthase
VNLTRVALRLEYVGTEYHGWQAQKSGVDTVQGYVERGLSKIANHPVRVVCAGRTDSGVHATHQIVHFDTEASRPETAWILGTNANLPDSISVVWSGNVDSEFSARFSATSRQYCYYIRNSNIRSAIADQLLTRDHRHLDADAMHEAAQFLLGENDFSSFRASHCQSFSPVRNVTSVSVTRSGELIKIDITANAFLHHMVRNIAGVLMDVGAGVKPINWVTDLLAKKDRKQGSITASPSGLFLVNVSYPAHFGLPERPSLPIFDRT